jgi:hypothetical protein
MAEGYYVVGFDVERHRYPLFTAREKDHGTKVGGISFNGYGTPNYKAVAFNGTAEKRLRESQGEAIGWQEYPARLVLQDVLTIHGKQFKDAALIVASPPCQEYSYMAMPWSRAKAIAAEYRSGVRDVKKLTALFDACFRIQREAIEAAGHFIPLVVENVRGAIPWIGRSRWNYGSFHLWGDVPALMPLTTKGTKHGGDCFNDPSWPGTQGGVKQPGISRKRDNGRGDAWFQDGAATHGSRSNARKAASAMIAKIPLPLARHIADYWKPKR